MIDAPSHWNRRGPDPRDPWNCHSCGRLTAHRSLATRLGLIRAGNAELCSTCYSRSRPPREVRGHRRPCCAKRPNDPVVVLRILQGDQRVAATNRELAEAVSYLLGHGLTAREVALRCGCTMRTVQRHVQRRRAAASSEVAA